MMETETRIILVYKGEIIYNIRYRTETHIHRHGTKLFVRATEQNNYTVNLSIGKSRISKELS